MNKLKCLFLLVVISACSFNKKTVKYTYWDEKSKAKIRTKMETTNDIVDGFCDRFYINGQLLSRTKYNDNRLMEIYEVYDTLGNRLNYGYLKNGTGRVVMFDDRTGTKYMEGKYVNGLRQGWWKNYSTNGFLVDSLFFKDGIWDNHEYYLDLLY